MIKEVDILKSCSNFSMSKLICGMALKGGGGPRSEKFET